MIDSYLRDTYQKVLVDPILPIIVRFNISPAYCTLGALASGILILPALMWNLPLFALAFLLLSGYLDTLDGSIARYKNRASDQGAMFDILSDRIVESCVIMGLYAVDPLSRGWPCLFMLASVLICVTSFLVTGIFINKNSEKSFYYSPGLMERTEAFMFFGLMIAIPSGFMALSILFSVLVAMTGIKRAFDFTL